MSQAGSTRNPRSERPRAPGHTAGALPRGDWDDLRRFYEDTWSDYRWGWITRRAAGMHSGYALSARSSQADSLLAMNAVIADTVGVRRGDRVLDAGCGVGGTSVWLAAERGARVLGINIVPSQIEWAIRRARRLRVAQHVEFALADLSDSGLPAESFDVAWLQESACHIPDKAGMLAEMQRVLRPGGRLAVADFFVSPGAAARDDFRTWVASWQMALASEDAWRAALASTGFENVRLLDVTGPVRLSLERLQRRLHWFERPLRLLERMGLRNENQIRNSRGGQAMGSALEAGAFRYGILTADRTPPRATNAV